MRTLSAILLVFAAISVCSQNLPVIHATSELVTIKEDYKLSMSTWTIVPEAKPDVYETSASHVSFITDIDSIAFHIEKGKQYDFIIVLNGKDSAYTQIIWAPSKLDILKGGREFNYSDDRYIPKFTYENESSAGLQKLRRELNLDSIAGDGSELSQIFNLMHWLHNLIRHDGTSSNPALKNAPDLIRVCRTENRGVNCRMLAIILNECYLSMGIKSRYVTCMPKELEFDDCHVINMVYATELKKWIWIDPSFDAYVMDDKGNLLGLWEVRERLINDLPLVLNADANWNRNSIMTKEYYLDYYMAKNLYRFQISAESKYNNETAEEGKTIQFVELIPLDAENQSPQFEEKLIEKTGVRYVYYKTNNPELIWQKPE